MSLATLPAAAETGRAVVYTPRGYAPGDPAWRPRARELRADAADLRALGVDLVATWASPRVLAPVCRHLKRHGLPSVVLGVADPGDAAEVRAAAHARRCADGYAVGSGGLGTRYDRDALRAAVTRLRATGRPVVVREAADVLATDAVLRALGDEPSPLAFPSADEGSQAACGIAIADYRRVEQTLPAGQILRLGASGLAAAGGGVANPSYQRAYFLCLSSRGVPAAMFEAYDQPWRTTPVGPHAGLFRADGTPRRFAQELLRLTLTATLEPDGRLHGRVAPAVGARWRVVPWSHGTTWAPGVPVPIERDGRWQAAVAPGRPWAATLEPRDAPPPVASAPPPAVDEERVYAVVQSPR
ncbi:MAG: hypothetical protein KIT14_21745 [bacterium]|nr:hypothetical protein [bacterium]